MLVVHSTHPADLLALADMLGHLNECLDERTRDELATLAHGRSLGELAKALHAATDPASIRSASELLAANEGGCACSGDAPPEPTASQIEAAADRLTREAIAPFTRNPALRDHLASLGCRFELPADS